VHPSFTTEQPSPASVQYQKSVRAFEGRLLNQRKLIADQSLFPDQGQNIQATTHLRPLLDFFSSSQGFHTRTHDAISSRGG